MVSSRKFIVLTGAALLLLLVVSQSPVVEANPIGICIRNCAQCKKMFGPYFEGQLCADACVKFKGKIVPDCEDIVSIAPFLTKFE
ncbi:PREDICTED: eclosion hormone-like [Nicrophorus vespilloides]|uniref:Eclosion hormone-like n=1 Tax=Nicrophorus vespilloides TaxID=110193 RepID=A0ABM1M903_NICVS|nr:PREDICTED: eclosion hormone-like [Nicrophorus vespilloides]